jgi:hypothetical protein
LKVYRSTNAFNHINSSYRSCQKKMIGVKGKYEEQIDFNTERL